MANPLATKLVIFADGSYLEFFNWYDTPPFLNDENLPVSHSAEDSVQAVNDRLSEGPDGDAGLGIKFGKPIARSRKKVDGVEIKWKVTRPELSKGAKTPDPELFANGRIDVPFFCHDVTPRTDRVPYYDEKKTTHPCGAIVIAACEILAPKHLLTKYVHVYCKILGSKAASAADQNSYVLDVGVPEGPVRSTVVVRAAETEQDMKRMQERGIGFSDLVIAIKTNGSGGETRRQLGPTGIESAIWLETAKRE